MARQVCAALWRVCPYLRYSHLSGGVGEAVICESPLDSRAAEREAGAELGARQGRYPVGG